MMKTEFPLVQETASQQKKLSGQFDLLIQIYRRMRTRTAGVLFVLGFLPLICAPSLQAQTDNSVDGVTVKGDNVYAMHGGQMELLTDNLKLPFDIEVNTNGYFKVGKGQERKLEEGQILRSDGWLLNRDGSAWPVFDYVALKDGKVVVVRDGQSETLTTPTMFPGNLKINPDGSCVYPDGSSARLVDGQMFRLDGTSIPAKDTVTLKDGQVVVQKSGKLIPLGPSQIMGMNDGSRVRWDGTIVKPDGTTIQLQEGKTIFIDGPAPAH